MLLRPTNFVIRLRKVIYELIYHQKRLAELGPQFLSCNERQSNCNPKFSKANPRKGCPECKFTQETKKFRERLERELKYLPRTTRKGSIKWPLNKLLQVANETAFFSHSTKGNNPKWAVTTAMFVGIYRDEVAKMKGIQAYRDRQDAEVAVKAAKEERERYGR